MNLIDENIEKESEEKQKKVTKLIITAIAVLIAIVVFILIFSAIKKKNTLTVTVNEQKVQFKASLFLMEDKKHMKKSESGEIYISVRELANMLGDDVGYFNDEYNGKGEDTRKCHIQTQNEYTSYIADSPSIYKVRDNKAANDEIRKQIQNNKNQENQIELLVSDTEYEYFNIDGGVIYANDEIYATKSAIELGFNVRIIYNEKNKSVSIYTLDGLNQVAANTIGSSVVTDDIEYYNKKLLKYGYALVRSSNGDYGIQDYQSYQEGNYVLSCKYSAIKYIEGLDCLIVTTSDKGQKGILKLDRATGNVTTLVEPVYQEINQITGDGTLYVIKESGKYGLLRIKDDKAENVLKSEYQTIGIDNYSDYEEMEDRYLIDGKYIPIKRDDKWGVASIEGKVIVIPQYDVIGCNIKESGNPAICVPNLKKGTPGIIFGVKQTVVDPNQPNQQNEKYVYCLIGAESKQKIGFDSTEIYATYINNEREYVMKIQAADGSIHRINIYDAYSEPARTKTPNTTNNNQNNNNQNNNNQNNNNQNNNNQSNNNQSNTNTQNNTNTAN